MRVKVCRVKKGVPYCPHCQLPIESDVVDIGICACSFCGGYVRYLTENNLINILRNVDKKMIEEWKLEMKYY